MFTTINLILYNFSAIRLCVGCAWEFGGCVTSNPMPMLTFENNWVGIRSLFSSNKNPISSRLLISSWVKHVPNITCHIVGTRGLVKMCSLGAHDTICEIIHTKPKLVFSNLWVGTIWRFLFVAYVGGGQRLLLGPTCLGYTFHFHVGMEHETFAMDLQCFMCTLVPCIQSPRFFSHFRKTPSMNHLKIHQC